ncbi:MAG TPA: hypothetical protein VGH03_15350 [Caulobacteraceae bacterium]|jgi:hypothetical protein
MKRMLTIVFATALLAGGAASAQSGYYGHHHHVHHSHAWCWRHLHRHSC